MAKTSKAGTRPALSRVEPPNDSVETRDSSDFEQPTAPNFRNLLSNERVPSPQKRAVIQNIARTYGNKEVQRVLAQTKASASHKVARKSVREPTPHTNSRTLKPLIQRFDSFEHQSLGNVATGNATISMEGEAPGKQFELSHGDIIALSGDYFQTKTLLDLVAVSGKNGSRVGRSRRDYLRTLRYG